MEKLSSESVSKRKVQAAATRDRIFYCANELFSQKEYEKITVAEICRNAGVSVGAFYHHFESKESILSEGYRQFDSEVEESWNEWHPGTPVEDIRFLISLQAGAMESNGYFGSLQYFKNQLSANEKYILDKSRFFYRTIYESVELAKAVGLMSGNTDEITDNLLALTRGTIYDWCLHSGSYGLKEKCDFVVSLVLSYYSQNAKIDGNRKSPLESTPT